MKNRPTRVRNTIVSGAHTLEMQILRGSEDE
jgi:hypothetical protein